MKVKELINILESKDQEAEIIILSIEFEHIDGWDHSREVKNQITENMIRVGGGTFEKDIEGKIIIDLDKDY